MIIVTFDIPGKPLKRYNKYVDIPRLGCIIEEMNIELPESFRLEMDNLAVAAKSFQSETMSNAFSIMYKNLRM